MTGDLSTLVAPHGNGRLNPLLVPEAERAEALRRARRLRTVPMSSREVSDLLMLAMGAYTPLSGFMGEADWRGCCLDMKTADGLFWPIPITLSCEADRADGIAIGQEVALVDAAGAIFGTLEVVEKYAIDRALECANVYRTSDTAHPGVEKLMRQGAVNLAGPVVALAEGHYPDTYAGLYYRPPMPRRSGPARRRCNRRRLSLASWVARAVAAPRRT